MQLAAGENVLLNGIHQRRKQIGRSSHPARPAWNRDILLVALAGINVRLPEQRQVVTRISRRPSHVQAGSDQQDRARSGGVMAPTSFGRRDRSRGR